MEKEIIHFVGIGGIGMSALAQLFVVRGARVSGTDRSASPVTNMLQKKGVDVKVGHLKDHVPKDVTLLVYSDAVPFENPERVYARECGVKECSYFEALGEATQEGVSIVISGTHGKTTTTAMVAKMLIDAGKKPTVIAGSILREYGSNFVAGKEDLFVIEGCEYRRHFLNLHPTILIITNIELDHTDHYKDLSDMQNAFRSVLERVPPHGAVITNTASETIAPVIVGSSIPVVSYQNTPLPSLRTGGEFNRENARAAKCAVQALYTDVTEETLNASLSNYSGTWRRFEYKGETKNGATVYDDYAHHPTAVEKTILMAKEEFPDKKIVVIFHPHLYSRTKQFFTEFGHALSLAHKTFLLPIYAARENPDPSISSEKLAEEVSRNEGEGIYVATFEEAEELLQKENKDSLIITMGAGDVYVVGDVLVAK